MFFHDSQSWLVYDIVLPTELQYHILWFSQDARYILWLNPPPICDPKSHSFRPADLVTQHVLSPRTRVEGSLGGLAVESWKKTLENSGRGLQNISEHHWIQSYIPNTSYF
jgi:hypothetical protein